MNLKFNFDNITAIEFGVGMDEIEGSSFCAMQVDGDAQIALRDIALDTWQATQELEQEIGNITRMYDPSEKYASSEYVYLPLDDALAIQMRELHQANNLPIDMNALRDPSKVFCYFARMVDGEGQRLTALRRASQFKGTLKSRFIGIIDDSLKLVREPVFRLDNSFDLLIDNDNIHILRPNGFEIVGQLKEAILSAVPRNIELLQEDLSFVDFTIIQDYAKSHIRAARHIASIRYQSETKNINQSALKQYCAENGVEILESNGKIMIQEDQALDFLEVLDRRRYQLVLIDGSPERFRAPSRQKVNT
jgi:hypothetical protein